MSTENTQASCCCTQEAPKEPRTAATTLSARDQWGLLMCRISNRFRMKYVVTPGLYRVGSPDASSPVLLSANYKLSFDHLRR